MAQPILPPTSLLEDYWLSSKVFENLYSLRKTLEAETQEHKLAKKIIYKNNTTKKPLSKGYHGYEKISAHCLQSSAVYAVQGL